MTSHGERDREHGPASGDAAPHAGRLLPQLSLRTWLLGSHLVVLLLPILALIGTGALAMDLRRQTQVDLEHQADVLTLLTAELLADLPAPDQLDALLAEVRSKTLASIQIVDVHGQVVAASARDEIAQIGDLDMSDDEVVRAALRGETGVATRDRGPPSERTPLSSESRRARVRLFIAKPIYAAASAPNPGEIIGAVLLSRTPREELQALYQMSPQLVWGLLLAVFLTIGVAVFAGRLASRSLQSLADAARRITHGSGRESAKLIRSAGSHVDEVRALATATAAMAEQLQTRVDYINEFAGNVAHEFRTPIATLRGTAELLRDDDSMPPDRRRRFLDNALDELERLERLVDGLLALARAEQPHDGGRIVLAQLLASLPERWPDIRVSTPELAEPVEGSAAQLATVLDNLLDNAFAHAGPEVAIEVRALARMGGKTGFEVIDDGPGISAANQARIFDRFFTTNREQGGTGLGLALVHRIVETHGGTIELESAPGRTCMRVWLPIAN
jgi:signal transduction histidine kinase